MTTERATRQTTDMAAAEAVTRAWSARAHVIAGFVALVVLVGGFGTWSVTSNIAGAIIAPGAIEIEQNRQVVQHPDGGVIQSIDVREGDVVEKGDVLVRLDPEILRSELTIVENQLFEIIARRGRLEAERDDLPEITFDPFLVDMADNVSGARGFMEGQQRLHAQRRDTLAAETQQMEKRIGQIASQNEGIQAQQAAITRQLELLDEELANMKSLLERGLAQSSVVLQLERNKAALEGQAGELTALLAENEGRMTEIEIGILNLKQARREEAIGTLRDLGYQEVELSERRRALVAQLGRLDVRAPLGGVVHAMQVFAEREVIRPAQEILFLVPQDQPLVIGARVDPIHIDEVHVGQDVTLRFSSLDGRTSPTLEARVITVSADALVDEQTGLSYYRTRIVLKDGEMEKLPEGTVLVPGMPVESFLRTGERSPMAYLVKPLADYLNTAMRES